MLMITIDQSDDATELRLAGRLSRPEISELERCLRTVAASRPSSIVVDLTDVTFVDAAGKDLLAQIHQLLPQCQERVRRSGALPGRELVKLHE